MSVSVIVGQIRSTAADLLAATGMSYEQAAGAVREAVREARGARCDRAELGAGPRVAGRAARPRRAGAAPARCSTVASRLCGVHAQLMGSAELTLWARLEELTPRRGRARRCGRSGRS